MSHLKAHIIYATYDCATPRMNESCRIWIRHATCDWVMSRMNVSLHIWPSYATYKCATPRMNESWHVWMNLRGNCWRSSSWVPKTDLYTRKRALYPLKSGERALHTWKRGQQALDICTRCIYAKEPYYMQKSRIRCIHAKESLHTCKRAVFIYLHGKIWRHSSSWLTWTTCAAKQTYTHAKEPCIHAKEPCLYLHGKIWRQSSSWLTSTTCAAK